MREIGFTTSVDYISLVAVFIPVLFMGGIVGPRVPRIRGHDQHDHPDLRLGLADAHADAGVAHAAAGNMAGATMRSTALPSPCSTDDRRYEWGLRRVLRFKLVTLVSRSPRLC